MAGGVRALRLLGGLGHRDRDGPHRARAGLCGAVAPRRRVPATAHRGGSMRVATRRAPQRSEIDAGAVFVYIVLAGVAVVVGGILISVLLDAFATSWFGGWMPDAYTDRWFRAAITEFQIPQILGATAVITLSVTAIGVLIGVPASYVLARRRFRGKGIVQLLLLLPLLLPPITYGIPLATMLYEFRVAGTMIGVIIANLVP